MSAGLISTLKLTAGGVLLGLLVFGLLQLRAHYIEVGASQVQARWDAADAEAGRQALMREQTERAKEQARQQEAEKVAHEQAQKERERADRDQRTAGTVRSLRITIENLNTQLAAVSSSSPDTERAAAVDAARTARELLGQCAERYSRVGAAADRLRDQVTGLQSFAVNACQAGQPEAEH